MTKAIWEYATSHWAVICLAVLALILVLVFVYDMIQWRHAIRSRKSKP